MILEFPERVEMHDYFYGSQSDQFTFYRIPTVLFSDRQYKDLSPEAKVLYGILLKRMELSARNGWFDEDGRVYIVFTIDEIMEMMNCKNQKAIKLLDELGDQYGLIDRKRQGLGKPNLIYVKNFIDPGDDSSKSHIRKCENHTSGDVKNTIQELSESHSSNTDNSYTENSETDLIYPGSDGMGQRRFTERYFKEIIEYDALIQDYPNERQTLDGIVDLLTDACTTNRETIRIAGEDRPIEIVRSRLMKLNHACIRYVLLCLKETHSDVKNIKQYLLTILYNAPATISPYYQTKVNCGFDREGENL